MNGKHLVFNVVLPSVVLAFAVEVLLSSLGVRQAMEWPFQVAVCLLSFFVVFLALSRRYW